MRNIKIILYIATSLDGYIARRNGSVDFLDKYNGLDEDFGYKEFHDSVETIIIGNTTYREFGHTKEFENLYRDKKMFVFSKKEKGKKKNVVFVNQHVKEFVNTLKGNVWLMGGASIFSEFLKHDLVDEFIITIIPVILGEGIALFKHGTEKKLKLINTKSYKSGVVQLHYKKEH